MTERTMQPRGQGSRIAGFYRLSRRERLAHLSERLDLSAADLAELEATTALPFDVADHMVENAVSVLGLPLGVGLNFLINGRDYIVPMAVEEPSVVAAASFAARLVRDAGGFTADAAPSLMIGQIQLVNVPDLNASVPRVQQATSRLLAAANAVHPNMQRRGGGAHAIEVRPLPDTACGPMLVVHLLVDVGDAMGANAVNSMAEALAPLLEDVTGGQARMRILSNLADQRLARASARIPFELLADGEYGGREVAERLMEAWAFADADPYRATTHNKGIMNGIDALAIATGNDWRGIEAGAHAYAARSGQYRPLSQWRIDGDALAGAIELPLAVGIVGGNLQLNPRVQLSLKLLGVNSARELAAVMAAVGLGQNLAAIRALVTDGIQRGHMALHARGVAIAAGAPEALVGRVIEHLIACGEIKISKAREILDSFGLSDRLLAST
ncbi:MAG: hydroxymethylglutaryl-CoA reductase, degradative [Deltaproteobacteria bacterium]|nr:hydroxymethylglutaryl-CoA reductase, degradative [Deltaproteobacteria bacterium]MBI3388485.1 hydroxymethylglutaryl-CoA reductase, degradative [Deltaproteobacteria bacterium]